MSVTAMTRAEMVSEVANIIGRDATTYSADGSTLYSTRIKQWLYWSHLTMARAYAFPELDADPIDYTLSTSTNVYTFTTLALTRIRQILGVRIIDGTNSRKLTQKLYRTFEEDYPNVAADSAQKPCEYTIYGRRIELDRLPDSAYTMRIRINQFPDDFASDSDTSDYLQKDDVIVAGAVVHAYISLQEIEDAKAWASIFAGRLQAAVSLVSEPQDWEPEGRAFGMNGRASYPIGGYEANPLVMFNP